MKNAKINKPFWYFLWPIPLIVILVSGCTTTPDSWNQRTQSTFKRTQFMLSFDDGPVPGATERVLEMLSKLNAVDGTPVKAGFFLVGDAPEDFWQRRTVYAPYELWTKKGSILKYPDIVKRIHDEGHIIGNHTTHHPWFRWPWFNTPDSLESEFNTWEAIWAKTVNESSRRLFRPSYGTLTQSISETANRLRYQIILGESVGDAVPNASLKTVKNRVEEILNTWDEANPCVLIFHDIRPVTYEYLTDIVQYLQQEGFVLVHFEPENL